MRLTGHEKQAIADAVKTTFPSGTTVALFGSRVDDAQRGGDIDLLVETPYPLEPDRLVHCRSALISSLYKALDEQRIDVLIVATDEEAGLPIVQAARRHGVMLVP